MTRTTPFRILLALLLAATSTAACAARSIKSPSPLPKDPAALLALAARHNGLIGPNLKPWHIQATYQLYDPKGNPTQKGTFNEWWATPSKYTITFDRSSYHLRRVVNANGTFVSGNDAIPYPESLVRRIVVNPVTPKLPAKGMRLHPNIEKFGNLNLQCVEEIPNGLQPTGFHLDTPTFPTYCFEPSSPILRIYGSYGQSLTEITSIGILEGRYIPLDAVIFDRGRKYLSVHLDQGESAAQWPSTIFTAPPESGSIKVSSLHSFHLKAKDLAPRKVGGDIPIYPYLAKEHNQEGTVKLAAWIGTDGRMQSLVVASAPAMALANSALAAVKTWRYKPYLVHGHPVSVETTITVIYTLGN